MIKSLKVEKLLGRFDFDLTFHEDLNIFTGKNGCGKTSLLKLLWYAVSEQLTLGYKELPFEDLKFTSATQDFIAYPIPNGLAISGPQDNSQERSLFFPTFRIIEGGFNASRNIIDGTIKKQSKFPHEFVETYLAEDVDHRLIQEYARISEAIQKLDQEQSEYVLKTIEESQGNEPAVLQEIKQRQQQANQKRAELLRPFTTLSALIDRFYADKGIEISSGLHLGSATDIVSSEHLSSGERQMLGILTFCFFAKDTVIFIDEPELSLHPDWQRLLLPTLLDLGPSNQYFIATHSPFIYADYPDKDFMLDLDRGGK